MTDMFSVYMSYFNFSKSLLKIYLSRNTIKATAIDGQGGLACCSSWGRKESDTTEQLN